jgi:hypothetical protein
MKLSSAILDLGARGGGGASGQHDATAAVIPLYQFERRLGGPRAGLARAGIGIPSH